MRRVTGIGGIVFGSRHPKALVEWYRRHPGIDIADRGAAAFRWGTDQDPSGTTLWRPFAADAGLRRAGHTGLHGG